MTTATYALTGSDTIVINGAPLTDFPDGDVAKITYDTDNVTVKVGKNGNTMYVQNEAGRKAKLEIRLMRGSGDDVRLASLQKIQNDNLPAFVLMSGLLNKAIGDGAGHVTNDQYNLTGGVFTKPVEVTSNVEGEKEQAVSVYMTEWAAAVRVV